MLDTVRPGGLLPAVYHDLDDEHGEHMKSRGVDPAGYVGVDDLAGMLGDDLRLVLRAIELRVERSGYCRGSARELGTDGGTWARHRSNASTPPFGAVFYSVSHV